MDKFFQITQKGSNIKTETLAGITTFVTMAYIIFVNPTLIGGSNIQISNSVFFATCLSGFIGTMLMAVLAKLPFAQAPGMGLNAFFAFSVMPAMVALSGNPNLSVVNQYKMALSLVFLSGLLFILITLLGFKESVISAIPTNIKTSISCGVGMFLAFLGLQSSQLVVANPATLVGLVDFTKTFDPVLGVAARSAIITLIGLIIITVLYLLNIKGSILIGILSSTILSYMPIIGTSSVPDDFSINIGSQVSDFFEVGFLTFIEGFAMLFSDKNLFNVISTMLVLIISFSLVDMFDTIGTFIGTARAANLLDENGNMKNMKPALMCDAIATTTGAMIGSSTVTTFVESTAGIGEGGKTGFTSFVTAILFLLSIFIAPFIGLIPPASTAPALIFVGSLMIKDISNVNFKNLDEAIPAFLTFIMMPLSYSISNGIAIGLLSYVLIKTFSGKIKDIKPLTFILALLFVIKYAIISF
ncbi:MAG: NCS2 family permease [Oscillospiraceae bacterium]